MEIGAGFKVFESRHDLRVLINRVVRPEWIKDNRRKSILKIPFVIFHNDDKVLLTDMRKAPASKPRKGDSDNRCVTVPFSWVEPHELLGANLSFPEVAEEKLSGSKGIVEGEKRHISNVVGIYKAYQTDKEKAPTDVMTIPVNVNFGAEQPPEIQENYRRFRGEAKWFETTDAIKLLKEQQENMPTNHIAIEALVVLNYASQHRQQLLGVVC